MTDTHLRITAIASAGAGSVDERRLELLREGLDYSMISVDRSVGRIRGVLRVLRALWKRRADLIMLENTGIVTGVPVLLLSLLTRGGMRYVLSSGDAVGPYVRAKAGAVPGLIASLYERLLIRRSFAYVGTTPLFLGRALQLGAPRGVTVPNFHAIDRAKIDPAARQSLRSAWGVPDDGFVVGLMGSIARPGAAGFGYGMELVGMARRLDDPAYRFVVIGDGPGLDGIKTAAAEDGRFVFVGRIPADAVPGHLSALDLSVNAQTIDLVGGMRWTNKLPELVACGVPCLVTATPAFLELVLPAEGLIEVLPECPPGSPEHFDGLAERAEQVRLAGSRARNVDAPLVHALSVEAARARLLTALHAWKLLP